MTVYRHIQAFKVSEKWWVSAETPRQDCGIRWAHGSGFRVTQISRHSHTMQVWPETMLLSIAVTPKP